MSSAATRRCWITCSSTDRARARVSRFQYARNNADFPESLRGDDTRPERISDHDMPVAYFVFFGAPVVTLAGDATMTIEKCQPFTDPGATAFDDTLGALPVAVSGTIDPNVPGTYTISLHREQRLRDDHRDANDPRRRHDAAGAHAQRTGRRDDRGRNRLDRSGGDGDRHRAAPI